MLLHIQIIEILYEHYLCDSTITGVMGLIVGFCCMSYSVLLEWLLLQKDYIKLVLWQSL